MADAGARSGNSLLNVDLLFLCFRFLERRLLFHLPMGRTSVDQYNKFRAGELVCQF
jgi:hypothetical protein